MAPISNGDAGFKGGSKDIVLLDIAKFVATEVLTREEKLDVLECEISAARQAGSDGSAHVSGDSAARLIALLRAERQIKAL